MLNNQYFSRVRARQRGASAVEFGIIAMLFFTLFFGIIEFGRFFYLYNTVQEVTRCAARQAVVTWKGNNDDWSGVNVIGTTTPIRQYCLFNNNELVAGWEISSPNIHLRALNLAGGKANPNGINKNITNCVISSAGTNCIRFVEASIVVENSCDNNGENCQPIQYQPMFGLIPLQVGIPNSTVRMPAESLGYIPPP